MANPLRFLSLLLFVGLAASAAANAQSSAAKPTGDTKLDRAIKLTIRSQYNVPPDYSITLGKRAKSEINGYDQLPVTFMSGAGQTKTTNFLISSDNNTLARLEKFDLTKNPAALISILGRPIRGNPQAKVTVISFDDLECPFCSRMNAVLFPGTEKHYGSLVRYVYKDFPLPMHPWAMHAAVDVNCLAAQSPTGYWNLVDYIHSHSDEISGPRGQENVAQSFLTLDSLTRDEGKRQNADLKKLNSCIGKQDDSAIRQSIKEGDTVGVDGTPTLFINGERAAGALSQDMLWSIIDRALRDAGQTPPPQSSTTPATTPAAAPVR
jgi:protein-disulfide isomerase